MKYLFVILLGCLLMQGVKVQAASDTIRLSRDTITLSTSSQKKRHQGVADTAKKIVLHSDPAKAVWMAAIVPGLGQIYNKKYWKLPIIYGGFAGLAYAITWNGRMYSDYKKAYLDLTDNNPNTNSYWDLLPPGSTDLGPYGGKNGLSNMLQSRINSFRRFRDMSIIFTVGLYALSVVDAYVDAQLSDFDISPDLSAKIAPTLISNPHQNSTVTSLGVVFKLNF